MVNIFYKDFNDRINIVDSSNEYLIDTNNDKWLDATSGGFAVTLGYKIKEINDAMIEVSNTISQCHHFQHKHIYTNKLSNTMNMYPFFKNNYSDVITLGSASDAMELAMRTIIKKNVLNKESNRIKFLSRDNAYYGGTLGCYTISDRKTYKKYTSYAYMDCLHFKAPIGIYTEEDSINDLLYQIEKYEPENIAGIIVELIPSTSCGVYIPTQKYNETIQNICLEYNIPFIVDDVVTNTGRVGYVSSCEYYSNIIPDIIIQGKGITNGIVPCGATIFKNSFLDIFKHFKESIDISFTALNNPIVCNLWSEMLLYMLKNDMYTKVRQNHHVIKDMIKNLTYRIDTLGNWLGIDIPNEKINIIKNKFLKEKIFVFSGVSQTKNCSNIVFAWPLCTSHENIQNSLQLLIELL